MASTCEEAAPPVLGHFGVGLKVMIVDGDAISLRILEQMLRKCMYSVTTCSKAAVALNLLRERKGFFDVLLCDVHMPDMDAFKLLELVKLEMDIPVIMMFVDDSVSLIMKSIRQGVRQGACDYLIKPIHIEAVKNIWLHVERKRFSEPGIPKRESCNGPVTSKKPAGLWTVELHQQFVGAFNQLGVDKVTPKRILDLMNAPGLTRENVASHLQKYRLYLKRLSRASQPHGDLPSSCCAPLEPNSKVGMLGRFHIQALAASGQIPPQTLAALHAELLNRPTGTVISPAPDQSALLQSSLPASSKCTTLDQNVAYVNQLMKCSCNISLPESTEPLLLAGRLQDAELKLPPSVGGGLSGQMIDRIKKSNTAFFGGATSPLPSHFAVGEIRVPISGTNQEKMCGKDNGNKVQQEPTKNYLYCSVGGTPLLQRLIINTTFLALFFFVILVFYLAHKRLGFLLSLFLF